MSAEVPTPSPDKRGSRLLLLSSNRKQVILFAVLTLVLTVATVWGGRVWLKNSETLTFAVGEAGGPEARFAAKLAAMLKATGREDFVAAVRALDRMLISGHFVVPLFYLPEQWVAHWSRLAHPARTSLYGYLPETWWHQAGPVAQ